MRSARELTGVFADERDEKLLSILISVGPQCYILQFLVRTKFQHVRRSAEIKINAESDRTYLATVFLRNTDNTEVAALAARSGFSGDLRLKLCDRNFPDTSKRGS